MLHFGTSAHIPGAQIARLSPLTDEEKATLALWVDLGAVWDNLPGSDDISDYSAEESARLAAQAVQAIPALFTDPVAAAEIRCIQCHPLVRTLQARKTPQEWKACVVKMREKNAAWIKPEEVDPITAVIAEITGNSGLIRQWKVCGPFDNSDGAGVRETYGPETELDFDKTYTGKAGAEVAWKDVNLTDPTAILNFEVVLGAADMVTAYAHTTLESDAQRTVYLRLSGDNMFEVILNGEKVMQRLVSQPFWYDWDMVPLQLRAGSNDLLIKVHDEWGPWLLRARITESSHRMSKAAVLRSP